jgi:micrococcal nuclease
VIRCLMWLGAAALACATGVAAADERAVLAGTVTHVRDGDTIVVDGRPVRLNGLHAPELSEAGGTAARQWMVEHALGRRVVCQLDGSRTRDRVVGICRNEDGDLAAQLVAAGLGRDCPRFSGGRYAGLEVRTASATPLPHYCRRRAG